MRRWRGLGRPSLRIRSLPLLWYEVLVSEELCDEACHEQTTYLELPGHRGEVERMGYGEGDS